MDIVGPLPADRQHEFIIVFVDCFSQFTILVPASNHTADTVSDALLRHVVPYFGTPRRLLSDRGREFVGDVWGRLTSSLGIQRVLTSPYHPEGNSINERSHRTMNNMLRARLLRDLPSRKWVVEIPGIMLALNAMVHEPHGFSASMIATGREPSLPPDLESEACASPSTEDPVAYVDMVRQRLALTHQQMTPTPAPEASNPYHEGDLIFVMTTPPERTSKLAPRWKGPFVVKRVPNAYQVTYEDDMVWRTVHVNHAKPDKVPAGGFPVPVSPPAPPSPPPMYLSRNFTWKKPAAPPQPAAPVAEPTQPATTPRPVAHPPSRPVTRSSTRHQLAPRSEPRSPATPARTQAGQPLRRSARLNPRVCAVESRPQPAAPQLLRYEQCIGSREGPHSFCSLVLEDLHTGHKEYLGDTQQLIAALPRSLDPGSRLMLTAQVAPPGQRCLPQAMRASVRWPLPSDGEFQSAPDGQRYYLARQGRRVVLRGGDVKAPLANSRINWVYDSPPRQSHLIAPRQTTSKSKTNIITQKSHDKKPRNNIENNNGNQANNSPKNNDKNSNNKQGHNSLPPKKKRNRYYRRERRAIERAERGEMFNHDTQWARQCSGDPSSSSVPMGMTHSGPQHGDPISAMRPAVYYPHESVGSSRTNENSPFQIGTDAGEFPGLYKPADPDPQHHTWTYSSIANSLETGPPSPPRTLEACSSDSRTRTGIIYPLQPRQRRPDVCIDVEAPLPEPAALRRPDLQPSHEAPTGLSLTHKRLSRKRRRNRSTAIYRPAKLSPPRERWCDL